MAGLREKKKVRTQDSILRSASDLFADRGYVQTTVDEIAEHAEVGVGTVYNYFGSKRGLLIALMARETEELLKKGEAVLKQAAEDPETALADLFWVYMEGFLKFDRELMRELVSAAIAEPESVGKEMVGMDYRLVAQVGELLERFQQKGMVAGTLPREQASLILYSVISALLLMYLQGELPRDSIKGAIGYSINLIFRDWKGL